MTGTTGDEAGQTIEDLAAQAVAVATSEDIFAACSALEAHGDAPAVVAAYGTAAQALYSEQKKPTTMLMLGRAGAQYGLAKARAIGGEDPGKADDLKAQVRVLLFNIAANAWPGWDDPGIVIGRRDMIVGLDAALASRRLVLDADPTPIQVANAHWLVGALQFEVLASRIEMEYGLPVRFEASQFTSARRVHGPKDKVDAFAQANRQHISYDNDGDTVYLTRLQWDIDRVERDYPELRLSATKEMMV